MNQITITSLAQYIETIKKLRSYYPSNILVDNPTSHQKNAAGQLPCVYDDFIEEAKPLLTHEHRNNLRKLLDFRFRRHRLYNLPEQRLELIEAVVHQQARKLLKER